MNEAQNRIIALWEEIERDDEDISTERLIAMTAERMTAQGTPTSTDAVVDALEAEATEKQALLEAQKKE